MSCRKKCYLLPVSVQWDQTERREEHIYLRYMEWHSSDVCSVIDTISHSFSLQGTPGLPGPPGPVGPPGERVRFPQFMFWKDQVMSFLCFVGFFSPSLYIFQFSNVFFKRSPFISIPSGEKKAEGLETPQGWKLPQTAIVSQIGSVKIALLPPLTGFSAAFTHRAVCPLGRALPGHSAPLSSPHCCCCRGSLWNSAYLSVWEMSCW